MGICAAFKTPFSCFLFSSIRPSFEAIFPFLKNPFHISLSLKFDQISVPRARNLTKIISFRGQFALFKSPYFRPFSPHSYQNESWVPPGKYYMNVFGKFVQRLGISFPNDSVSSFLCISLFYSSVFSQIKSQSVYHLPKQTLQANDT